MCLRNRISSNVLLHTRMLKQVLRFWLLKFAVNKRVFASVNLACPLSPHSLPALKSPSPLSPQSLQSLQSPQSLQSIQLPSMFAILLGIFFDARDTVGTPRYSRDPLGTHSGALGTLGRLPDARGSVGMLLEAQRFSRNASWGTAIQSECFLRHSDPVGRAPILHGLEKNDNPWITHG